MKSSKSVIFWFVMAFVAPPVAWLLGLWYYYICNLEELLQVILTPSLWIYVSGYIAAITTVVYKKLKPIDIYLSGSRSEEDLKIVQRNISFLPIFFLGAIVVYCLIGPHTGLAGKSFLDTTEYFFGAVLGIPIIFVFSIPFFVNMLRTMELYTAEVVFPDDRKSFSIKSKIVIIFVFSVIGSCLILGLASLCIVNNMKDNPFMVLTEKLSYTGLLMSIIAIFNLIALLKQITEPIETLTEIAKEIAMGNFNIQRATKKSNDETGILANAFNQMIVSLKDKSETIDSIANNDISIAIKTVSSKDTFGKNLMKMSDNLNTILYQTNETCGQVVFGSDQLSSASQHLSQGATEQASAIEEISSSMTELLSQTKQSTDNSTLANEIALLTKDAAEAGNNQMKTLLEAMQNVNNSSIEIKKITKLIDDLAFQTNLLALNANVEAARAGKFGKGFSVVAAEVKNLAERSADAVRDTTEKIEEIIHNIEAGNQQVEITAKYLDEILKGVRKETDLLDEMAKASQEQANALNQINSGISQISQVTHSTTSSAEETAASAQELANQATKLKAMVAKFRLKETRNDHNGFPEKQRETNTGRDLSPALPIQITAERQGTVVGSHKPIE